MAGTDTLDRRHTLRVAGSACDDYSLAAAERNGLGSLDRLPFSLKVSLANMRRHADGRTVTPENAEAAHA